MYESLSQSQRTALGFDKGEFAQLRTKFRNPYFSPRVINALLEDIIEQAQVLLLEHGYSPPSPAFIKLLQTAVDDVGFQVVIKGISLLKFISIEVLTTPSAPGGLTFLLKPLNENGLQLLKAIESYRTPDPETARPSVAYEVPASKKVTRIVEI